MNSLIYIVEDDPLVAEWVEELITKEFGSGMEARLIGTHSSFLKEFKNIANDPPGCIIMDFMLQWSDEATSDGPKKLNSFLTAGIECYRMLMNDPRTKGIPILIYTVLDKADIRDLPRHAPYLRKDAPDEKLVDWVRAALNP